MLALNKATTATRRKRYAGPRHPVDLQRPVANWGIAKGYFWLGLTLLTLFMIQEIADLRWPWLGRLQGDDLYKQLSGFALLAYIAHQWHFSVLRARGLMRMAGGMIRQHKLIGAMAPVFFYAHSQRMGYAYQQALGVAFFAIFVTGLCNFEVTRIQKSWFQVLWITTHVALSVILLFLLAYHVYISYAYQ